MSFKYCVFALVLNLLLVKVQAWRINSEVFIILRWGCTVSAVVSEENAVGSNFSATDVFKLTFLEVGFSFLTFLLSSV